MENYPVKGWRKIGQSGTTLIELMVGLAVGGLTFLVMITLMTWGSSFNTRINGNFKAIEASSEAISLLYSIMPQVVEIDSCGCRGNNSTSRSNCTLSDSATSNLYYDPVINGGAANPVKIFTGYFEAYNGGGVTGDRHQLLTSQIGSAFTDLGGCKTYSYGAGTGFTVPQVRGCKLPISLNYTAPVVESGLLSSSTPSVGGKLAVSVGSVSTKGNTYFGSAHSDGNAARVVNLGCGLDQSGTTNGGLNFVLNIKLKSKATTSIKPSDAVYESWHPNGKNFGNGHFKDLRMKFAFPNLNVRGAYHWKMDSITGCLTNGTASTKKESCCSLAIDATKCIACIPSGTAPSVAGNANSCCSEALDANNGNVCI